MTADFLTDGELQAMSLPAAMRMAVSLSGLSDAAILARMGWSASYGYRVLRPHDDLWPALTALPRLCAVLGNGILTRWLELQAAAQMQQEAQPTCPPLTASSLSADLVDLFARVGAVAREGQATVRDGQISMEEARSLRGRVEDTLRLTAHMLERLCALHASLAADRQTKTSTKAEKAA